MNFSFLLILSFSFFIFSCNSYSVRYDGHVVLRCKMDDELLKFLEEENADVWSMNGEEQKVDVHLSPQQLKDLNHKFAEGKQCEVWMENLQKSIEQEQLINKQNRNSDNFFSDYQPYDEMVSFLDSLAKNHSSILSLFKVGNSTQGRTIWGVNLKVSGNQEKPNIYFQGGQHARGKKFFFFFFFFFLFSIFFIFYLFNFIF